ncbi:FHA domain-containing protein [Prosthecomicrobium sp. N25]|uniref:FHA domain-containing protein n=1 Tax=Prosthecomicrobium sp. N25 TaxID=3129254 RepID=UPI003076CC62
MIAKAAVAGTAAQPGGAPAGRTARGDGTPGRARPSGWTRLRAKIAAVAVAAFAAAALAAPALVLPAAAQEPTTFQPRCLVATLDNAPHAICETGAIAGGRITHVRFQKDGATGTAEANFLSFTTVGKSAAVLALVDRGDRRRTRTVGLAAADLPRLVEAARAAGPNNRFGVGLLADRFELSAQIGALRDEVARVAAAIRPDFTIGDPSRLVPDAIRQLTLAQAERYVLVLFSDGKTEDRGYGRDDVIKAARDAKVIVVALAYRERPEAPGPETGSLRRLAEETGGLFFDVGGATGRLDDAAVARFAQFVGSGGTATFPLNRNDPRGRYLITLEFESGRSVSGAFFADVAATPPPPPPPAQTATPPAQTGTPPARTVQGPQTVGGNAPPSGQQTAQAPPPRPATPPPPADAPGLAERSGLDNIKDWLAAEWRARPAVLVGIPLVLLLALGGVGFLQWRRRKRTPVLAWLELADDARTRVPVTGVGVRIGRHSDNDIRFENSTVHRFHAVLGRDVGTGQYVISDVSRDQERSNGVLVNGELVTKATLANGDVIELGEVKFRFLYA